MADSYDSLVLGLGANTHLSGINVASGTTLTDLGPGAHTFTAQGAASVNGEVGPYSLSKPTIPKTGSTSADYFLGASQLLGAANWAISFWAYLDLTSNPGAVNYCIYQEAGSAGSAINQVAWLGQSNAGMEMRFKFTNDSGTTFSVTTQALYLIRQYAHWVIIRNGSTVSIYMNGARQASSSGLSTSVAQAPTSPDARIGVDRNASLLPFIGGFWRFSIWNTLPTALSSTPDQTVRQIYETGAPVLPSTDLDVPLERNPGTFFAANAWVNQRLPKGNPGDTGYPIDPAYPMGSSALNTLINAPATPTTSPNQGVATQLTSSSSYPGIAGASGSSTRIYVITPSTPSNTYTVQPVAMWGGRYANSRVDKEDLWQSFRAVPIPNDAVASGVAYDPAPGGRYLANTGSPYQTLDQHCVIVRVNSNGTIEHWEMFEFRKALPKAAIANSTATVGASGSAVGANLPSGSYQYAITMFNGNGDSDTYNSGTAVATDGTKAITVTHTQFGEDPAVVAPSLAQANDGLLGFHVWRKQTTGDGNWYLLDTLTWVPGTNATAGSGPQQCGGSGGSRNVHAPVDYGTTGIQYIDDGSQALGAVNSGGSSLTSAATTSGVWSVGLGGYYPDLRQCTGAFDQPGKTDWGGTATSIMKMPGTITQRELAAGVIDHALGMAFGYTTLGTTAFVYPATRTDGIQSKGVLQEGTRMALPRAIDLSVYAPGVQPIMKAMQEFGFVVMDKSAGPTLYVEDTSTKGRDLVHIGLGLSTGASNPNGIDLSTVATVPGGLGSKFTFKATFTGSSATAAVTSMPSWVNLALAQTNAIPVSGTGITAGTTITGYNQTAGTVTFSTTPTAGTNITVTVVGFPWVLLVPIDPAWTQAQATTTPAKQAVKGRVG